MNTVPKHHQTIEEYQKKQRERAQDATLGCLCGLLASAIVIVTIIVGVVISMPE